MTRRPRTWCRTYSRRYRAPSSVSAARWLWETFLLAIAVKRARHHRRAAARRRHALSRLASEDRRWPRDPEQDAYRRELGVRLASALERLPLPQRVAFVLCEVEELTSAQAAEIAAVPEATVRTRLFHARRRLRGLLDGERDR